jgi:rubrerythrin
MNVFRCRICGVPYIGSEKPTHCPFCGARQRHLVVAADYHPPAVAGLSKKSREGLSRVLELEVDNSAFYRGAAKVADTEEGQALFAALSRIEAEHAAIVCRLLGVDAPEELLETGACSPSHKENLTEAHKREERGGNLYRRLLGEAEEERAQEVLAAFVEIANDHLALDV